MIAYPNYKLYFPVWALGTYARQEAAATAETQAE